MPPDVTSTSQRRKLLNNELGFRSVAAHDGGRAIVTIDVERVCDSCGMGLPLMHYQGERSQYLAWIKSQQKNSDNALLDRVAEWNVRVSMGSQHSIPRYCHGVAHNLNAWC